MDAGDPKPPVEFANRVIQQLADHIVGRSDLDPNDYVLIRVLFRRFAGSWVALCQGDPKHMTLLANAVTAWGQTGK